MSVLILIDGSNFYHMLRSRYGIFPINLDWHMLPQAVLKRLPTGASQSGPIELRYYIGGLSLIDDPHGHARQQVLFGAIRASGGTVWTGRLVTRARETKCLYCKTRFVPTIPCPQCGKIVPTIVKVEKGVDVKIAADAVQAVATGTHDTIVIASQDGDFMPVADAVRSLRGKFFCLSTPILTADKNAGRVPAILRNHESVIWMTRKFLEACGVKGNVK